MNKFIPSLLGLAAGLTLSVSQSQAAVISGFNGFFDEANWNLVPAPRGEASFVGSSLVLVSADEEDGWGDDPVDTVAYISVPVDGTISFAWSYLSADVSTANDPAGYTLNSIPGVLSAFPGNLSQSGVFTLSVLANDIFGFYAFSIDQLGGAATLTITDFTFTYESDTSVIPEPGSVFAIGTLLSSGLLLRLRRKARN